MGAGVNRQVLAMVDAGIAPSRTHAQPVFGCHNSIIAIAAHKLAPIRFTAAIGVEIGRVQEISSCRHKRIKSGSAFFVRQTLASIPAKGHGAQTKLGYA